ncbi:hypothetical protein DRO02_01140 [archaeon]|nr:MAG: hypothetical protein DRO02_01140 [archaeon]RLG66021.1 MAG: hypothetical protein DRO21_00500 [archaeon]RLG66424.1 MAG: hypothetical protein DRN89_00910 [archaeon]HDM23773.1 hypothetical protein [Candidatus Bathyarchaeota archaeon]
MPKKIEAWIVNFRLGGKRVYPKQLILKVKDEYEKDADPNKMLGSRVEIPWIHETFIGKITKKHGKHHWLATFRKGLPGQVLGHTVYIYLRD